MRWSGTHEYGRFGADKERYAKVCAGWGDTEMNGMKHLRYHCSTCKIRLVGIWIKMMGDVNGAGIIKSEELREQQSKKEYARALENVMMPLILSICKNR